MLSNAQVRSVVEATISLAHALQMRVVAEGVESEEQMRFVRRVGLAVGAGR